MNYAKADPETIAQAMMEEFGTPRIPSRSPDGAARAAALLAELL